jgi:SMI1 / KNR4 family (SUKH-1)
MKEILMKECEEPTSVQDIEKFETIINTKLPEDYKSFLLKYNGGRPIKEDCFKYVETINGKTRVTGSGIEWFMALYGGKFNNILKEYNLLKGRIPYEMIPIANGFCGNAICLCIRGANYGKVYYWDHENENPEDDNPWYENVYLIANSFTDFINSLHEYEEPEE